MSQFDAAEQLGVSWIRVALWISIRRLIPTHNSIGQAGVTREAVESVLKKDSGRGASINAGYSSPISDAVSFGASDRPPIRTARVSECRRTEPLILPRDIGDSRTNATDSLR